MQKKLKVIFSTLMCFTFLFTLSPLSVHAQTVTSNQTGTHGGYSYEYWKDNGNGTMVLKDGGAFSCEWSNINNILFRKGLKYNETQTHQQIGNMSMTYACNYQPNGNSYLSVYGWTSSPLVEYYIIESWGTWKPPGNVQSKGTVNIDGGIYDIFETTRTNQPSIKGTATFQQYWSVRQQKRTSGTISVSEHFKAWEAKGMKMGKFYEISLVVEGYQSSGKADVTEMSIDISGTPIASPTFTAPPPPTYTDYGTKLLGDVDKNGEINSLDFAMFRQYLLGTRSSIPSEGDIDKNGSINSIDFAMLRQHLLGIINLATSIPAVSPTPTFAPRPNGTIKIMPLGDSITDGLTVAGGYRIKLWEHFKSIGASVDFVGSMSNGPSSLGDKNHEGHSGWTISQIDEKINGWMDTYKPQIVLLHIGTNDMYQKPAGASDRLGTLIDKICAKLPAGGKLYVSNIIPFTMYDVTAYNATIPGIVQQKASQGKPVYFVEMYKALTTADLADGVHANATGYNKMADVWFNAIKGDLAN